MPARDRAWRVLMLSDVYFPRINGVSTSTLTFRQELERRGHQVFLLAPRYGAENGDGDPRLVRVPAPRVPFDPEDRLLSARRLVAAAAAFPLTTIDLVHIQTPFAAHRAGLTLARRLGVPAVETYHTYFERYFGHYIPFVPDRVLARLARRLTVMQCRALDGLVVPSRPMLEVLRGYGVRERAEVIPTGLRLDHFRRGGGDGAAFRARHGIAADRPVLVHIGRLAHEKNIGFLLAVHERVLRRRPDALFLIAGEGPAQPALARQARRLGTESSVRFLGYLDRSGPLLDCYAAGDVFVFSSRTETQGLVLLEALALGVPVVSTAELGTRDLLDEPGVGALVALPDLDDFAAKVLRVLEDRGLARRLAEEGPRAAERWSAGPMAERLLAFYAQVLAA